MATLHDELVADFLDDGDEFEGSESEEENGDQDGVNGLADGDEDMAEEEAEARVKDEDSLNQEDKVNKAIEESISFTFYGDVVAVMHDRLTAEVFNLILADMEWVDDVLWT